MPTYEYRCTQCENEFEKFQRMSDESGAECPACGRPSERKLSGGAGLLFKGSGFYITDYRSDSYKKEAKAESGGGDKGSASGAGDKGSAAGGGDKGSASGGDAKPAAKADAKPTKAD